jgi:hypothetical protein
MTTWAGRFRRTEGAEADVPKKTISNNELLSFPVAAYYSEEVYSTPILKPINASLTFFWT